MIIWRASATGTTTVVEGGGNRWRWEWKWGVGVAEGAEDANGRETGVNLLPMSLK